MKKRLFFYLFASLLTAGSMTFTSCSDDDENEVIIYPIDEELAGEYKGTLDIVMLEVSLAEDAPKNITITKAGDSSINLMLSDFSMELNGAQVSLGTITLEGCVLSQRTGGGYTFVGQQTLSLSVGNCDVVVSGSIVNSTITVNLTITWNDIPIYVTFEGTKLTGTESSEAALLSFEFNDEYGIIVDGTLNIDETNLTITYMVLETATTEQLNSLEPVITVSDGATYTLSSTNFSQNVTLTIVAEDGTVVVYTIVAPTLATSWSFSFEEWDETTNAYPTPYPTDILATSNPGAAYAGLSSYPVVIEEDGYAGRAAKLVTLDSRTSLAAIMGMGITSGSLFTGTFTLDLSAIFSGGMLACSKFGVVYDKEPLLFKGVYKYTPGSPYITATETSSSNGIFPEVEGAVDECSIQAVLYEVEDESDTLDGNNINTATNRVAIAQLEDGSAKDEWTTFSIPFTWLDGQTYDASKTYKLAIVCSSSKDGDKSMGAINSTLWVDELEVIGAAE